jgi:aldehyde:ferredoxin oxidoreductase
MKFLHVDMTRQHINVKDIPSEYIGLGGRGLTSILINAEVPPDCDPLGPDNKLVRCWSIPAGCPSVPKAL